MHWLIVPGPPVSCYAAYMPPAPDPGVMSCFHRHPNTWSIHVVLSGQGTHVAEGVTNEVGAGSVIYQGPGVRHALFPKPNHHLFHIVVQHPGVGHTAQEFELCPEAGTADRFGDLDAFVERFGTTDPNEFMRRMLAETIFSGPRWTEFARSHPR
jgi:mannose-6-phosphate isomerase-like protein (cupin superfamily)